jgi:plastocyanin
MARRLATVSLCSALLALAGCGSSSSSSSSSSGSGAASSKPATTAAGGLKATTTPRFVPASGPVRSGTVPVAYRNITIAPGALRVKVGSTVKWTNFDTIAHNVTSEGGPQKFASKDFGERGTYEIKALKPGVIHYECTIHPASMNGTIEVVK